MSGRYRNARDGNEKEIVAALRKMGFSAAHMDRPVDLLIGKRDRTWIAEVKGKKGKLTKAQVEFYATWRGNKLILRSIQDAAEWAAQIEKETQ